MSKNDKLQQDTWQTRLTWAEKRPDHPLSETLRLAARMALERTNEETPGEET